MIEPRKMRFRASGRNWWFFRLNPVFRHYPSEPVARAKVDFMLYWDAGTLYPALAKAIYPHLGLMPKTEEFPAHQKTFDEKLQFLNDHLIDGPFLTGPNLTIADMSVACSLSFATLVDDEPYKKFPKITEWLEKMNADEKYAQVDAGFQTIRKAMKEADTKQ